MPRPDDSAHPTKRLWVGFLPHTTTKEDVRSVFGRQEDSRARESVVWGGGRGRGLRTRAAPAALAGPAPPPPPFEARTPPPPHYTHPPPCVRGFPPTLPRFGELQEAFVTGGHDGGEKYAFVSYSSVKDATNAQRSLHGKVGGVGEGSAGACAATCTRPPTRAAPHPSRPPLPPPHTPPLQAIPSLAGQRPLLVVFKVPRYQ